MLNSEEPNIKKEVGGGAETYEGGKDRTFREVGGEPGECHAGDQMEESFKSIRASGQQGEESQGNQVQCRQQKQILDVATWKSISRE